jgi:acetoin utilization protein AcuB
VLTMWSINSQAEQYVPGVIRKIRSVEKVSASAPVSSVKEPQGHGSSGDQSFNFKGKVAEVYGDSQDGPSRRAPAILAQQVMTSPVVWLDLKTAMAEAWKLIHQRRFRHVPVVNSDQRIVGILSDRDLWREAAGIHTHPEAESIALPNLTVQDIMTDRVLTGHPDTEIRTIARVMFEERIGAMPIVNDMGTPIGIITRSDILRTVMNQVPFELWI